MKGVYKKINERLFFAEKEIRYPNGDILEVKKHMKKKEGTEIKDGWLIFHTRKNALEYFGIEEPELIPFGISPRMLP